MKLALVLGIFIGCLELSCGLRTATLTLQGTTRLSAAQPAEQEPRVLTREEKEATKTEILQHSRAEEPEANPITTCVNGSKTVQHTEGQTQFWPTIDKEVCDGLLCEGQCVSISNSTVVAGWRLAYTITLVPFPQITIHGWQYVTYVNHDECDCLSCKKFTKFEECQCQDGCPGFVADKLYSDSFCYWNETNTVTADTKFPFLDANCTCCKVPSKCPENQVFSRRDCECRCLHGQQDCKHPKLFNIATCSCECPTVCHPDYFQDPDTCECICNRKCPPHTVLDPDNCVCIGECKAFSGNDLCEQVHCDANTQCKLDHNGVCDCLKLGPPEDCSDITDEKMCVDTTCPNQPEFTCRFNSTVGCFCPCCYPRTDPPHLDCGAVSPLGPAACDAVNAGNSCRWLCP